MSKWALRSDSGQKKKKKKKKLAYIHWHSNYARPSLILFTSSHRLVLGGVTQKKNSLAPCSNIQNLSKILHIQLEPDPWFITPGISDVWNWSNTQQYFLSYSLIKTKKFPFIQWKRHLPQRCNIKNLQAPSISAYKGGSERICSLPTHYSTLVTQDLHWHRKRSK